jgi:hypothetical protein
VNAGEEDSRFLDRQHRLPPLQKPAHGRIAFKTDRNLVGITGLGVSGCAREQLGARGPVRLVLEQARVASGIRQRCEGGIRPVQFGNSQRAIDCTTGERVNSNKASYSRATACQSARPLRR